MIHRLATWLPRMWRGSGTSRRPSGRSDSFVAIHEPLLGTRIEVAVEAHKRGASRQAAGHLASEIARLETIFSVFDPQSELRRWRDELLDRPPSHELADLLVAAADWTHRTDGAFNPATGELRELWLLAEEEGIAPAAAQLLKVAGKTHHLPYRGDDNGVEQTSSCHGVDLNAIAKGHIVDLAVRSVIADDAAANLDRVVVNAGGDVLHWGSGHLRVGIENPLRPYDNEPPLAVIDIAGEGVATSGRARRWFDIGGVRYSRVIDPRTGQPADHVASASVVAPDALTADVVATAATVLTVDEALRLVAGLGNVDCLLVGRDGAVARSPGWAEREQKA